MRRDAQEAGVARPRGAVELTEVAAEIAAGRDSRERGRSVRSSDGRASGVRKGSERGQLAVSTICPLLIVVSIG